MDLLLRVQNLIHLRDRRAYLRQRIHEIERGHDGRGLRNGDQIQHLAFLDPMILVHKLFFHQRDDDVAAAKGKRAEIQRGEKQLQQNAALFHTHPSRAEYITSCRIYKI